MKKPSKRRRGHSPWPTHATVYVIDLSTVRTESGDWSYAWAYDAPIRRVLPDPKPKRSKR